jgi:spermidine synthase
MNSSSFPTPGRAGLLAFLMAFVTLFAQILLHRVISLKLLNNYAFLVISLTMLGFAVSGVALSRMLTWVLPRLADVSAACAGLFALTTLATTCLFYRLDAGAQMHTTRPDFVRASLHWMPVSLLLAIPFLCTGLVLGALLADPRLQTRRVYFADLTGSALGALLVVPAIRLFGVENCLLLCGLVLVLGTAALVAPRGAVARALVVAGALGVALSAMAPDLVFRMRYPPETPLAATQGESAPWKLEYVAWDALARIEVSSVTPPDPEHTFFPSLFGPDRAFHQRFRKLLTQNNYAFTYAVDYDGDPRSLKGIEQTIYSAAYAATSQARPKVAVIGVGGGFDVLCALAANASRVVAIEINSATVGILRTAFREYFRHWVDDPRVTLVNEEGRHYLSTSSESFDVLQLSGVDTYAGTPGAAHVFSENYLYTAEAFDTYLSRLTQDGILNMMRLEYPTPREMLKALVLATEALRRGGVTDPARHIMMLSQTNGAFVALLVKKTPFTEEEQSRLQRWAQSNPYLELAAAPGLNSARANAYQAFLALEDPRLEARFVADYPYDVAAPSDDRPFFFHHAFWWHLFPADPRIWGGSVPVMEYSVLLLGLLVSAGSVLTIYLPLRTFGARGMRTPRVFRHVVFFAGTAVGYMAVEMALLQRFGLFLGHPNYALSIVLAALLLATGAGSLWSEVIVRRVRRLRFVSYVLAVVVLSEYLGLLPHLPSWIAWPMPLRAALVLGLVTPIGICLGVFVPAALERLKEDAPAFVPWAWGINGTFSVLAPILAVAFSLSWGIGALLLAALPIYLVVGLVAPEPVSAPAPAA